MNDVLYHEWVYLWYYFTVQLEQIFPYWVLGMMLGSAVSVFGKKSIHQLFEKLNGSRLGLLGILPACLLGIASPLCMVGTIPLAAAFSQKGLRQEWIASFMMSSILLNPQLIVISAVLGIQLVIIRVFSCFLCGVFAGFLVWLFYRNYSFFDFSAFEEPRNRDVDPSRLIRFLKNLGRNIKATGPWFLLGIVLSALFQHYVPASFMTAFLGGNEAFGVLMAATIGVPLYVCGGGTIPLLQMWLMEGMSYGSAAAFMLSGPATKITNLSALKMVLGVKRFCLYLAYIFVFSLMNGFIIHLGW